MIRYILAALLLALPVSAASVLQYKGGYESSYTGQTGSECNVAQSAFCTLGTAFNNGTNKYINALAVFTPGSSWSPAGGQIFCWLVPSWDGGSTYESTPSALATVRQPDFSISVQAGTTVTSVWTADGVILKPGYQKMICNNNTGTTIPTSSTIILYPYVTQTN
jgi:hypothetical protein